MRKFYLMKDDDDDDEEDDEEYGNSSSIHFLCFLGRETSAAEIIPLSPSENPSHRPLFCREAAGQGMIADATTVITDAKKVTPNKEVTNERCCRAVTRNNRLGGIFFFFPFVVSFFLILMGRLYCLFSYYSTPFAFVRFHSVT